MKKYSYIIALLMAVVVFAGCENYETYSDMKKKEQDAIEAFIAEQGIQVIDQTTFEAQGNKTDLASNQFVKFTRNGVYMQIVRKGCGSILEDKKKVEILCRFSEYNIKADSMLLRNDILTGGYINGVFYDFSAFPEKMSVERTGTIYTASFVQESSLMYAYHGTANVPSGWLVPLAYINLGRPQYDGDEVAKVRLIVPHSQGTANASASVYPCFYEITYETDI